MKNLFVPYELAAKLKERGFNEPCFLCYVDEEYKSFDDLMFTIEFVESKLEDCCFKKNSDFNNSITAPFFQQVVDWFRDKHNIEIVVFPKSYAGGISYCFDCIKTGKRSTEENLENLTKGIYVVYNSSKECYNAAFDEALEIINE